MAKISIAQLKAEINEVIVANGTQSIIGSILNGVLQDLVDSVQGGSIYYGSSVPSGSLGQAGDLYFCQTNLTIYFKISSNWYSIYTIPIDNAPTLNSNNLVSSGGVYSVLLAKADLIDGLIPLSQIPPLGTTRTYANIAARNADTNLTGVAFGYVLDASADPAVGSGSAVYFNNNGTSWVLVSDQNELNLVVSWSNVTGKPTYFNTQWGLISGSLSSQSDLVAAFAAKMNLTTIDTTPISGNTTHIISSDGVYQALVLKANASALSAHIANLSNPHQVTLEQARSQNNQLQGNIDANNNTIINLPNATLSSQPATFGQLSALIADSVKPPLPIDCSANPNYPSAVAGDSYKVSVAGMIGGGSGLVVSVGDLIIASIANAGGTQASVGGYWGVYQTLLEQATNTVYGIVRLATDAEAIAGSSSTGVLTPYSGKELYNQMAKTVYYQMNPRGVTEVSFYMRNAGNINSTTIVGGSNVFIKTGTGGTYPSTQTYPYAYNAGDQIFVTFTYSDTLNLNCNLVLNCQDN